MFQCTENHLGKNELVIFRHPVSGNERLGFVGGFIRNPYIKRSAIDKESEYDVVVLVPEGYEGNGNEHVETRSFVFERKIAASGALLKVSDNIT